MTGLRQQSDGSGARGRSERIVMYYEWIIAALGVIVVYILLGYAWTWLSERKDGD